MPAPAEFERRMERIEALLEQMEQAEPQVRDSVRELVQSLMDLHGAGLERMLAIMRGGNGASFALMQQFASDELIRSLLLLYDLHPAPLEQRVQQGLVKAGPYLKSHGGNVDLLGIDDEGVVRLRLKGTCHTCPSSSVTLKLVIEEAIRELAPEISAVVVEADAEPAAAAPVALVQIRASGSSARRNAASERTPLPVASAR
jgi:Fe-S cluster biogenesis protein NfuA